MGKYKYQMECVESIMLFFFNKRCKHWLVIFDNLSSLFLCNMILVLGKMSLSSLPQILFPTIYKVYFLLENYFFDFCIKWSRILLQCICNSFVALRVGKKTDCKRQCSTSLKIHKGLVIKDLPLCKKRGKNPPKNGFLAFTDQALSACFNYPCDF